MQIFVLIFAQELLDIEVCISMFSISNLIFILIILFVPSYIAYSIISRIHSRKKMMKGIGVKNGRVSGVDISCADSMRLCLPLYRFSRMFFELLLLCLIYLVICIHDIITSPMDDYQSNMILICCLLYFIYACITNIIYSPKIWFDKDGMHTKDRIPENKDFIAKDALIAITILIVIGCLWGIYIKIFLLKSFPFWLMISLALSLALSYFLYTHRNEDLTLIKKNEQPLYDRLVNGFLLNDIEWKEIERIEYKTSWFTRWTWRIPFYRIHNASCLNVKFKNKEYDSISLDLEYDLNNYSTLEYLIPLYQYDHRILVPLATLCKAHGVNFLCSGKKVHDNW